MINISSNTKVIARWHTESNGTGLNIYNPYFQDQRLDVVYLLFKNNKPDPLVEGLKNLNIVGAVTAGFERDPKLPKLVDRVTSAVKMVNRVGVVINENGALKAHYQGGEGLFSAVLEKTNFNNKHVVLVGAGTVARTFALALEESGKSIEKISIYNRTIEKAEEVQRLFKSVVSVGSLDDFRVAKGDILVNASRIGSKAKDEIFNAKVINGFETVVDVTFGTENTNLISLAKKENKIIVTGWDMFTHQVAVVLKYILDHHADIDRLRYFVRKGLSTINHGVVR